MRPSIGPVRTQEEFDKRMDELVAQYPIPITWHSHPDNPKYKNEKMALGLESDFLKDPGPVLEKVKALEQDNNQRQKMADYYEAKHHPKHLSFNSNKEPEFDPFKKKTKRVFGNRG